MKDTQFHKQAKARNKPVTLITSESSRQLFPALLPRGWFRRTLARRTLGMKLLLYLVVIVGIILIGICIAFAMSL
jgi:hypothetical protein